VDGVALGWVFAELAQAGDPGVIDNDVEGHGSVVSIHVVA
jgi:hypothetical protein